MGICGLSQEQLKRALVLFLNNHYPEVTVQEKYIYAEGAIPVALVAHLDTVFPQPPQDFYFDQEQNVMWSPQGLGADDRAGVAAIIKIILGGYKPSIIFTLDEETTSNGAIDLSQIHMPFSKLNMIVELDRQGEKDSVFYKCNNLAFEQYINKFGFETAEGSFSDISLFAPYWGVAAVNLSIGYENEHSIGEILHLDWMDRTINRVENIFDDVLDLENPNRNISYRYVPKESVHHCHICGKPLHGIEAINIKVSNNDNTYCEYYLCEDCYDDML